MIATPANETGIKVEKNYEADGEFWIETPTPRDWEDVKHLPRLVDFEGRRYGWSCYNSDRHMAVFSTRFAGKYAVGVKGSGKVGRR